MKKNDIEKLVLKVLHEELSAVYEETGDDVDNSEKSSPTVWEKIKYGFSKLGSYKVDGELLPKDKRKAREEAAKKMEAILSKESNKFIKDLDDKIKQENPEFPNTVKGEDFLNSVLSIAACYDSIVEAVKKEGEGNIPVDVANGIINDLREYVKKILDVDLSAAYSTVDENKDQEEEQEKEILDEDKAADIRKQFKADRAARAGEDDKEEFKSTKIDTLKSNKLPKYLTIPGSILGGYGWLVNTDWFKDLFTTNIDVSPKDIVEDSKEVIRIRRGEGVYELLERVTGIPLDGNQPPENLVNAFKQIGKGNAESGVERLCDKDGVMMKPGGALKGLKEFLRDPEKYKNLGQFFQGEATGTGKTIPTDTTLYGTISGKDIVYNLIKKIGQTAPKTTAVIGAKYFVLKSIGSVLGPIGAALITAGAVVKLMRMKGLRQSRAATLNSLYQSLRNIPNGVVVAPEGPVDNAIEVPPPVPPETFAPPTDTTGGADVGAPLPPEEETPKGSVEPEAAPKEKKKRTKKEKETPPESKEVEKPEELKEKEPISKEKKKNKKIEIPIATEDDDIFDITRKNAILITSAKSGIFDRTEKTTSYRELLNKGDILTSSEKKDILVMFKKASIKGKKDIIKQLKDDGKNVYNLITYFIKNKAIDIQKELGAVLDYVAPEVKELDRPVTTSSKSTKGATSSKNKLKKSIEKALTAQNVDFTEDNISTIINTGISSVDNSIKIQSIRNVFGVTQAKAKIIRDLISSYYSKPKTKEVPSTEKETSIDEGKYIRDNESVIYLKDSISSPAVKFFESLLNNLELAKNKIKNIQNFEDPKMQTLLNKLKSNPIMELNFKSAFDINSENKEDLSDLSEFIKSFYNSIIKKQTDNINLSNQATSIDKSSIMEALEKEYIKKGIYEEFLRSTKYRTSIKNNILKFISDLFKLYKLKYK
jgi:hypothetical protein